jgi:biopolymer transport protein TolR
MRNRKAISGINVTPFVDVMLVLLVIFMVTSPMMVAGIDVNLPNVSAKALTNQEEPLTVTIDKHGNTFINNTQVARSDIAKKLRSIANEKYNTAIVIRGDKMAAYDHVIAVLGLINSAGFSRVALATEQ